MTEPSIFSKRPAIWETCGDRIVLAFKDRFKSLLRPGARAVASRLSRRAFSLTDTLRKKEQAARAHRTLAGVRLLGTGVRVNGALHLSGAKGAAIGNNVHIGDNAYFRAEGGLVIGDNTHISRNVTIYTVNHEYEGEALPYDHRLRYRAVTIGRNVWIGMNVNIAPGTRIGDGAIIGMGTTVSGVVPPLSIVAPQKPQVLAHRDPDRYARLEDARRYGSPSGRLLTAEAVEDFRPVLSVVRPFFVVSTGRSGSMTMARVLDQHPDIACVHEPHSALIRLSTLWAEQERDRDRLKADLRAIYDSAVSPSSTYGESDQNLSLLLDPLLDLFPSARVIWLIRDGRDVVASGIARNWYGSGVSSSVRRAAWDAHRLQGDRVGDVSERVWAGWSPFEKNCWYWAYVNRTVRSRLELLDRSQWVLVRIEELPDQIATLFQHVGAEPTEVTVERHNQSTKAARRWDKWTNDEHEAFDRICGSEMDAAYPGWRVEGAAAPPPSRQG